MWPTVFLDRLDAAVSDIVMWKTSPDDAKTERRALRLDRERLGELTEAWLPVLTPYGPGILLSKNKAWR